MKKRINDVSSLKHILGEVVTDNNLTYGLEKVQIKDVWKKIANEGIIRYTDDIRLQGSTLFIKLSSAPLKENLSLEKSRLIEMINEEFGKEVVKEIIF
ncbi:MAG: DUF721 domain-containing protein [Capnocytophaga sp.]|nr:DUF721 domain-containing protein [Capnocytophaga sp.]